MKTVLNYGQFLGSLRNEIRVTDFSLAEVNDIADTNIPQHTHEDAHFLFVVQGLYISTAKNADDYCSPATLIFNPAGTTHRDRFHTRGGRFFTVSIANSAIRELQQPFNLVNQAIAFTSGALPWLTARLYREFKQHDSLSPLIMEGISLELLAHLVRHEMSVEKDPPRWLKFAHDLIRDRCTEHVTIGDVARTVGVHPFHLTRTFRRFFRSSPAEFLRNCRIEKAALLLADRKHTLSEVALACGFSDQSQFTKTFKATTGLTPGEHRRLFS